MRALACRADLSQSRHWSRQRYQLLASWAMRQYARARLVSHKENYLERLKKASGDRCKTARRLAIRDQVGQHPEGVSEEAPTTYTDCLGP